MDWNKLKSDNWFILREKGSYKQKGMIAYSVIKNNPDNTKSIICYLNFRAVIELKKRFNFPVQKEEKECCWLNHFGFMDFQDQMKTPLMITFA